jgi:hypothetical protein
MANDDPAVYRNYTREDFDAIVTGELTHLCVWLELALETAIEKYFAVRKDALEVFRRLMLHRDGVTFQAKIELVRSIINEDEFDDEYRAAWKKVLKEIEAIERIRNAMAHGKDAGGSGLEMKIGTLNRAGKEVTIMVSPDSHVKGLDEGEKLKTQVTKLAAVIRRARE